MAQCKDCIHSEICQFYNALGAKVICYPCGFYEAKSNEELFKQALVEGLNRRFDKTIEEAKKIEKQIEEMARTLCGEKEQSCAECESCYRCEFWHECSVLHHAGYRKQSEGEWIMERTPTFYHYYTCSVCGWDFCREDSQIDEKFLEGSDLLYCPNCGSKMKGVEQ